MKAVRIAPLVMLLLVAVLVASCQTAPRASGASTAAHTGTSVAPGQLAWKFKAGDWAGDPTISAGLVYVAGDDGNMDEEFSASLYAVDAASGAERWKCTLASDRVDSSPAVSGGLVYVGTWASYVYALDAASGAERWKQKTGLEMDTASPVVSGGLVYITGTGSNEGADGRADGGRYAVCALDAASGAERWRFTSNAPLFDSLVVSGDLVYVVSSGEPDHPEGESVIETGPEPAGWLYALDAASGTERWKFSLVDGSSPVVSGGLVYVGEVDRYLHALDAASGTERWKFDVGGAGSPAVSGGLVYVGGDRYLYALDAATGAQRWKVKTGEWVYDSPVVSGGLVYVGSADGHLYAVTTGAAGPATTGTGVSSAAGSTVPSQTTASPEPDTPSTHASEPPTESTLAASPDVVKYVSEVMAWSFLQGVTIGDDLDRLREIDVTKMSASDLQVVERATVHLQTLSNLLRSIKVPAEAAGVHKKLVAGLDARFAIVEKELMAMRNKDQAGADAAKEAGVWGGPEAFRSAGTEWMEKYGEISRRVWESITLPKTQYQAAVMAWVKAFRAWANNGSGGEMTVETWAVTMTDPAQVARAHDFGDQLRVMKPPAAMAAVHQKLVDAFDAWLAMLDEQLAAGKDPDQATLGPVETAYTGAMQDWFIAQFPSFPLSMD